MPTDLRVRYDEGVRRRAAEMFAEGSGYRATAGELGLPPTTATKWHRTYAAIGLEGLLSMGGSCRSYSWEVKVAAAKAVVDGAEPKADVMARYGIASLSPLERWCKAYREAGPDALRPRPKGRPKGSKAAGGGTSREQELERRVRKLEAENAYLKKSIALKAEKRSRTGRKPRP